jgi:hypothetical protein
MYLTDGTKVRFQHDSDAGRGGELIEFQATQIDF